MKFLLTSILIIHSVIAYGQVGNTYQIDKELLDCLDSSKNYSTKGMIDCVSMATKKWDAELNKAYKELLDLMTAEQKEKLKISQREWIQFRDKEIEFSNQLYYDLEGTMWIPIAAQKKLDLTKKRTIELESFISVLTLNK